MRVNVVSLRKRHNTSLSIENIFLSIYVLEPYVGFYLCLREDWLENEWDMYERIPEKMKIVLHRTGKNEGFYNKEARYSFESSLMLPQMFEEDAEPRAYYFSPVHFAKNGFGYAVLCRELTDYAKFYLIGVGEYDGFDEKKEIERFNRILHEVAVRDSKAYPITASFGMALSEKGTAKDFDAVLAEADAKMYSCKQRRKST